MSERRRLVSTVIMAMLEARGGELTAAEVVDAARDPASPLHGEFEWDDSLAAEHHRLGQARRIIRRVRVTVIDQGLTLVVPAMIRNPDKPRNEQGYISINRLSKDQDAARVATIAEFARVTYHLSRAKAVATVLGMEAEIQSLEDMTLTLRNRLIEGKPT